MTERNSYYYGDGFVMTRLILVVFCVLAVYFIGCGSEADVGNRAEEQNDTYVNEKFGFEVEYPKNLLIAQGESANGYGQVFESQDKAAVLRTYAKFNTSDIPLEKSFERAQNGKVTEKNIDEKTGTFMVTGVHGGTVYYIKTYLIDDVYIVYEFRYPEDKKDYYGPINEAMSQSFKVL